MISEGTTEIFITFLLAVIGYAGLTLIVFLSLKKRIPLHLWRFIAVIIFVHVLMVWIFRYNWQFALAVRNGYTGFILFNSALLMIIISTIVKQNISAILIRLSFLIVTAGAIGATFRYDAVAIYKIPVVVLAVAGSGGLLCMLFRQRSHNK
jgi:hypothetical protein